MTNFTINSIAYEKRENGYCYKTENEKTVRIGKAEYEEAKAQAEKKTEKKAKKAKKNAVYTFKNGEQEITLTQKQMDFLTNLPNDDFFEHGVDSTLWTDVYCDTLANIMNAMVVGAIISTLREKNLIYIGQDKVNGKKCKFFGFTDLGKAIIKELGLV